MFDLTSIDVLTERYLTALKSEYEAKQHAQEERDGAEMLKTTVLDFAQRDGKIDGKNSDTRAAQREAVLSECDDYQEALQVIADAESKAARAEIVRKGIDAEIGLTKAWLYSQSGK